MDKILNKNRGLIHAVKRHFAEWITDRMVSIFKRVDLKKAM